MTEYLIFGSITIIIVWLSIHYFNKRKIRKNLERLREQWTSRKDEPFYFENIRRYADVVKSNFFHRLNDQTIEDIDFFGVFAFVDRTTSRVGQQFLFKKMIEPANAVDIRLEKLIDLFKEDKVIREEVQLQLLRLGNSDAYYISTLLRDDAISKPRWFRLLPLSLIAILVLAFLAFKFPVLLVALIIPFTVNLIVHYWNKSNTFRFTQSFKQLNILISVARAITKTDALHNPIVSTAASDLKSFQRKTSLIFADSSDGIQADLSLIGTYVAELFKAILLIEVFTLFSVLHALKNKKGSVMALFDYVGYIDAAISIADLRSSKVKTCKPVLTTSGKGVYTRSIYHPLIDNCVENSISITDKSVLITGSNMSGKSTFLRTLVINSILAQTIQTCFAEEFTSPVLRQFSLIRIDDDLFRGRSYYFQEVSLMRSLLSEAAHSHRCLFVLDELFKGTNTVERVAAAKAILSFLRRSDHIVVVSTHDIELVEMLEDEYELYHFTETIENDELCFDHLIKPGRLKTRNAIRILELSDYPAEVIREAREISGAFHQDADRGT